MRSPLLLSGPKIRVAYFEASKKKCYFNDPQKFDLNGVYEVTFFDLNPQSRLYEFFVQIKVMNLPFDCLYCNWIEDEDSP